MKQFLSIDDVPDPKGLVEEALTLKKDPFAYQEVGKNKVLGLIFFNPSLRTRMSMTKAAYNLGMRVITLNVTSDSWQLETEEGTVMNKGKAEHIKEAAGVMGLYCDLLAVRSFPTFESRERDYAETLLTDFVRYSDTPVINMESSTLHPLQSLADYMTITENMKGNKPKVVMTWAPHVNVLPQAVPNSFAQWISQSDFDFTITHPEGLELDKKFTGNAEIQYDQMEALKGADFVYVKNWSKYHDYGQKHSDPSWMINKDKLSVTNNARLMHCLPVRRNVVISDDAIDSEYSIIMAQAKNREYSAQIVLKKLLEGLE